MKLRPYHNPENVDESKVPAGWRFRYADEMNTGEPKSRLRNAHDKWVESSFMGALNWITYSVPATP